MDTSPPITGTDLPSVPTHLELTEAQVPRSWRLDEATREAGRRGIARARAALAATRRRDAGDEEHRQAA